MYKSIISILSLMLLIQTNAFAATLSGLNLQDASHISLMDASVGIDENSIMAWESTLDGQSEVLVKILNEDDVQLGYGCHLHGSALACHEEHHGQGTNHYNKDSAVTFNFINTANQSALKKFESTMQRKGQNLSVMTSYKVWTHKDTSSGHHGVGTDVWTKINYSLAGVQKVIFILCHQHGTDTNFSCHYGLTGAGEPALEFEDDDDHDDH